MKLPQIFTLTTLNILATQTKSPPPPPAPHGNHPKSETRRFQLKCRHFFISSSWSVTFVLHEIQQLLHKLNRASVPQPQSGYELQVIVTLRGLLCKSQINERLFSYYRQAVLSPVLLKHKLGVISQFACSIYP